MLTEDPSLVKPKVESVLPRRQMDRTDKLDPNMTQLTAESASDFNDPSAPDRVAPVSLETRIEDGMLSVRLPAHSFATVELNLG